MAEIEETKAVLAAISLAYPGRFKLDPGQLRETVVLWHGLLSDLPSGDALAACRALVASGPYPPAISEIRSEALSLSLTAGRKEAGDAWGEVTRAFGSHGRDRIPIWSSPAIAMSVRAVGGWRHLCSSSNAAADRAKFVDHLSGVLEQASGDVLKGKAASIEHALELRGAAHAELMRRSGIDAPLDQAKIVAELVGKVVKR